LAILLVVMLWLCDVLLVYMQGVAVIKDSDGRWAGELFSDSAT
jgi:hypothetical protein